jgi:hypothetical protein
LLLRAIALTSAAVPPSFRPLLPRRFRQQHLPLLPSLAFSTTLPPSASASIFDVFFLPTCVSRLARKHYEETNPI